MLTAVTSNSIDYSSRVVGIAFINDIAISSSSSIVMQWSVV
jgi:hypothetical protein